MESLFASLLIEVKVIFYVETCTTRVCIGSFEYEFIIIRYLNINEGDVSLRILCSDIPITWKLNLIWDNTVRSSPICLLREAIFALAYFNCTEMTQLEI